MKKAKIMLIAIAIIGLLGGILAFKARNFFGENYYALTLNGNGTKVWIQNYSTLREGAETTGFTSITTEPISGNPTGYFNNTIYYGVGLQTAVYFNVGE